MAVIKLDTLISADLQTCFDASRSIDAHAQSMAGSQEKPVAGRTSGLIGLHETVTWRAKHFGIWWQLTSRITQMDPPNSFTDQIVKGPFARMHHKHSFVPQGKHTLMIDEFNYASPLGKLGKFADWLFVERYMRRLLSQRNEWIRKYCEKQNAAKIDQNASPSALYIIGNGFDMYHGLDTRYKSFGVYLKHHYEEIYEYLLKYYYFQDVDDNEKNEYSPSWAELEETMADLDYEEVLEDNKNYLPGTYGEGFRDSDYHTFDQEIERVVDKLTKDLCSAFREFILAVTFPHDVNHKLIQLEPNAVFLNFNYTDTIEKYYGVHPMRLLYIHGKAKAADQDIILGHGVDPDNFADAEPVAPDGLTPEQLDQWIEEKSDQYDYAYDSGRKTMLSYFYHSYKFTGDIIQKNTPFFEKLKNIKNIYVFGHSLAMVDQPYFRKLIDAINIIHTLWVVTYFWVEDQMNYKNILIGMGVKKEQITMVKMESLPKLLPSLFRSE
jgi:ligand-binding SRPBCC domain-containing protein